MSAARASPEALEITGMSKVGGALTKRIRLGEDGTLIADGSACVMSAGIAKRVVLDGLPAFAALLPTLRAHEALTLGVLKPEHPQQVEIVTKKKLDELNGAGADCIARTGGHISYRQGQPALALLDVDTKAMPPAVADRVRQVGGFWKAVVSAVPELGQAGRVIRRSTSSGLSRTDTGEKLPGSGGQHIYIHVRDGTDIERFLKALHARAWLHGFGWLMIGAGGQLLERSIVDATVGAPERLVTPILEHPLAQDAVQRKPILIEGDAIDTATVCRCLTEVEQARLSGYA